MNWLNGEERKHTNQKSTNRCNQVARTQDSKWNIKDPESRKDNAQSRFFHKAFTHTTLVVSGFTPRSLGLVCFVWCMRLWSHWKTKHTPFLFVCCFTSYFLSMHFLCINQMQFQSSLCFKTIKNGHTMQVLRQKWLLLNSFKDTQKQ